MDDTTFLKALSYCLCVAVVAMILASNLASPNLRVVNDEVYLQVGHGFNGYEQLDEGWYRVEGPFEIVEEMNGKDGQ